MHPPRTDTRRPSHRVVRSRRRRLALAVGPLLAAVLALFGPSVPAHAADTTDRPVVALLRTPSGGGYWEVTAGGAVYAYGDARYAGGANTLTLKQSVVGGAPAPAGNGYWLVAADGGVFAYGDARFYGSAASLTLNQPVVGMAATPTGNGYWLVAADGGIFAYGDARFYGSAGSLTLNQPVVGMAATPTGNGYWLVAADGGVFAYGDARFFGRVAYTPPAPTGYRYVLPAGKAASSLTAPHHDYPALDIAVATGPPYFAITGGRVLRTSGSACGTGVILYGNDGAEYTFCHGSRHDVANGQVVSPGQQLGLTGNTGTSTGPHLHVQIKYPGTVLRCPQRLVAALAANAAPPAVRDLPTGGCFT